MTFPALIEHQPEQRVIAAFDFDGTLTRCDTFLPFLRHWQGSTRFGLGIALESPWLTAYALGLLDNERAKGRLLRRFLRGRQLADLHAAAKTFGTEWVPQHLRESIFARLAAHQAAGHRCVLASASPRLVLEHWASRHGFDAVLATELETIDSLLTGAYFGHNCHGQEKVRRLKAWLGTENLPILYAYGDTRGDLPMLQMADYAYYRGQAWSRSKP